MQISARVMTLPTASDRYQREAARLRDKAAATQDPTDTNRTIGDGPSI
jgi:hypothetical protein